MCYEWVVCNGHTYIPTDTLPYFTQQSKSTIIGTLAAVSQNIRWWLLNTNFILTRIISFSGDTLKDFFYFDQYLNQKSTERNTRAPLGVKGPAYM
jgi:hypothetical protein